MLKIFSTDLLKPSFFVPNIRNKIYFFMTGVYFVTTQILNYQFKGRLGYCLD